MSASDALVIPRFFVHSIENKAKSKAAGRVIYDDMECVEVRFAGNRQTISVFPALAICGQNQNEDGDFSPMTYAQRWPEQYKRFKAKQAQVAEGTPIDELPFIPQGKRLELKALSIYTAEALAALDGQELKNLGQGGRDLKNQAQAYLENAAGSADVTAMASKISELEQLVRELQANKTPTADGVSQFEAWESDQIKDWIEGKISERPKGNPSHATLVRRADEIAASLSDEAAAA
jgi:hypothetical protein